MFRVLTIGAALLAITPGTAQAYDWAVTANVVKIEVSYVPVNLPFTIDVAAGNCPVGTILSWRAHGGTADEKARNVEAVFAGLLTSRSTGRTVSIYGNNTDCSVDYIHLN